MDPALRLNPFWSRRSIYTSLGPAENREIDYR